MIDIFVSKLDDIDMILNIKKSFCMRIGKRQLHKTADLVVGGVALRWSDVFYAISALP